MLQLSPHRQITGNSAKKQPLGGGCFLIYLVQTDAKVERGQTLRLASPAFIVEIFETCKSFPGDIDKDGDTYSEDITAEDILRILKSSENHRITDK